MKKLFHAHCIGGHVPLTCITLLAGTLVLSACNQLDSDGPPIANGTDADVTNIEGNERMFKAATEIARCLEESGWDVQVTDGGGWGVEAGIPVGQEAAYQVAYEVCAIELGYNDVTMTEDLAAFNFENTSRVVSCLTDLGYETPSAPSRSAYITTLMEDPNSQPWDPYELIAEDDVAEAVFACPL